MKQEQRAVEILVEFSRLISRAAAPAEILPVLARAAVDHLGVAAAAVVQISPDGEARLAAAVGLPDGVDFVADGDVVGSEVGDALNRALGHAFAQADTVPLVSSGDVFGSLVLLSRTAGRLDDDRLVLLEGLVGLTGAALGGTARYAELARSYSDLRASREALEKGEKLRSLGQMAASVAHDLRNIINPLSLHLQLMKRAIPKGSEEALAVADMQAILKRGIQTIERLRDFSRQSPEKKAERSDLAALAHEALEIARPRAMAKHDVHYRLVEAPGPCPHVLVSPGECVAALVNLAVNAIDAMPAGGTLTVSTGGDGGEGWVKVVDDGPGMDAETERRVFEPFFTTKGEEGTGLGLAMVYAFAKRHSGRVILETSPGHGAAFTLFFPAAAGGR